MSRRNATLSLSLLILLGTLLLTFETRPVTGFGTIYIRADGSVEGTGYIETADNVTYVFAANIIAPIVVERSDIVINGNGYMLQGSGDGTGFSLLGVNNVTIKKAIIENFTYGIYLVSSDNILSGNNVANNGFGIFLHASSNNTLSDNNVANGVEGIHLDSSPNNTLSGNNVTANFSEGIHLDSSSNNTLSDNNVANNAGRFGHGIELQSSYNNTLSGNNVANNTWGISLAYSSNNALSANVMGGHGDNFMVYGATLNDYINSVDTSNLVNGKPIYYLMNQSNMVISPDAYPDVGYLGLVNCTNATVQGLTLTHSEGILLAFTKYSKITGNNVADNAEGIFLDSSCNNNLSDNNVTANRGNAIGLDASSNNTLSGNNVTENHGYGIFLGYSSNNALSDNNVTANAFAGIGLFSSSDNNTLLSNNVGNNGIGIMLAYSSDNNVLSGNDVTASNQYGVYLDSCSGNTLSGNDVAANKEDGIWLRNCSGNRIFHNNFSNNTYQTYVEGSINTWDKGYPSGGNYWGGFNPADGNKDKIGDVSYTIDENNTDSYPLIYPFEWYTPSYKPSPDLNEDGLVNVTDLLAASKAFGCKPGDPHWNPIADMGMNEIINIIDISKVAKHFGERV